MGVGSKEMVESESRLKIKEIYFICFLCTRLSARVHHMHAVPKEASRGHQVHLKLDL